MINEIETLKPKMSAHGYDFAWDAIKEVDKVAFKKINSPSLRYQMVIDVRDNYIIYEIHGVFEIMAKKTYNFKNYQDIIIPENDDEFCKLADYKDLI